MPEICQICEKEFENKNFLSRHVIFFHKIKFSEYFWKYKLKLSESPKCLNCGKETKYYSTKQNFCKYCDNKCQQEYEKNNGIKKLADEKRKQTNFKKYGVEHPTQNEEVSNRLSKTHKLLLNGEQGEKIKEKRKQGMLKNHGVEYVLQSEELKSKKEDTTLFRYGEKYYSQTDECKQRVVATCLKKYGTTSAVLNNDILEKKNKTLLNKYGTMIIAHVEGSQEKRRNHYEKIGKWTPLKDMKDFEHYRLLVEKYTRRISKILPDNKKRNFHEYHLDHKYSVLEGFKNGILPWILCCPHNLVVITKSENCSKRANCSITKEELIENYLKTKDQYWHLFRIGN